MSIDEDLRTTIIASTAVAAYIGTRMHMNVVPEVADETYIWYSVAAQEEQLDLAGGGGLKQTRFDVECISPDLDISQALAAAVTDNGASGSKLHGYRGTFGSLRAQAVFVENKTDDYIPKGVSADSGLHVSGLDLVVWHTT